MAGRDTTYENSEKWIEKSLVVGCKKLGLECFKLTSQYQKGMPDRMIVLAEGRIQFVETKSTGGKLSPMQRIMHEKLRLMGHFVEVIDNKDDLEFLLGVLKNRYSVPH